jgi:hypothetical protein
MLSSSTDIGSSTLSRTRFPGQSSILPSTRWLIQLCSTMVLFLSTRRTANAFVVLSRRTTIRLHSHEQNSPIIAASTITISRLFFSSSTTTEDSQASTSTSSPTPISSPGMYPFAEVEPKWQAYWEQHQTFKTPERDTSKPKKYVLDMFPYPSGAGLHVGHPEGYTGKCCCRKVLTDEGFENLRTSPWIPFRQLLMSWLDIGG